MSVYTLTQSLNLTVQHIKHIHNKHLMYKMTHCHYRHHHFLQKQELVPQSLLHLHPTLISWCSIMAYFATVFGAQGGTMYSHFSADACFLTAVSFAATRDDI